METRSCPLLTWAVSLTDPRSDRNRWLRTQPRWPRLPVLSHHGRRPEIALGRIHVGQVVTVHVAEDTITIDLADGDSRTIRRITTQPVRSIKAGLYLPVVQAAPLAIR